MRNKLKDFSRLCIHTMTNKPWNFRQCVENYNTAGIKGISVWRNVLEGQDIREAKRLLDDYPLEVVSIVRGGFFPSVEKKRRLSAIEDNLRAISQASILGAPLLVLVCGSDSSQSLEKSREQIM